MIMAEFQVVFNRLRELFFLKKENNNIVEGSSNSVLQFLDLVKDGNYPETTCFSDIDYSDDSATSWAASNHYGRLVQILRVDNGSMIKSDPVFRKKIMSLLRYWVKNDFLNSNWWYNSIGVPLNLANIAIAVYEYIPEDIREGLLKIISRGTPKGINREKIYSQTGANKMWDVAITIRYAILTGDKQLIREGVELATSELAYNPQGIQPDGSFFQHGGKFYSGGYGCEFIEEFSRIVYVLQGTEWQFSEEKLRIFVTVILDGLRYMTKNKALDYSSVGRYFSRRGSLASSKLLDSLDLLIKTAEIPRRNELQEYVLEITGKSVFKGTKYFENACLLCHHTGNLYIGAKFLSDKISSYENLNGESILCYNLSYGTSTCSMVDGSEYFDISPIWKYDRVPGTTAPANTDKDLLSYNWSGKVLQNAVYGGIQEGNCGIIFEKADHDGITAFVSAFAVPGGMVFLGSGISTEIERPLFTTVEQSFLQGKLRCDGSSVIHHGIRYTPLLNTKFFMETSSVIGSWKRNNLAESSLPVKGSLFTITIKHCIEDFRKKEKPSYAYMISSESSELPNIEIIRNDESVQAVKLNDGTVMAVFYENSEIKHENKIIRGCKNKALIRVARVEPHTSEIRSSGE